MRKVKWLVGASLAVLVAGCVDGGYPTTSYGGYGYSNGYYNNRPTYYRPAYYQAPQPRYYRYRDRDRDGIPDRYDRDKNGDGVPDRWQRRGW